MQLHTLVQNSPEWHTHRATHDNASDAPAMMGCSPYTTRSELLRQRATGISKEIDPVTQRRFDDGHRYEALARPLAEAIIEEDLYPCVGSNGSKSASFDGLTMLYDLAWEHKSLNDELRAVLPESADGIGDDSIGASLPLMYRVQMEQQADVSGCDRVLFTASKWQGDTLVEARHCWYRPDLGLRAQIAAGWAQFHADLADYVPTETSLAPVAAAVTALPAVSVQVSGSIVVRDNFKAFEVAARDFIENKLIRKPESDQDFVDLTLQIKALEKAEEALGAAEAQMLSQVDAVDAAKRTKDMLLKLVRDNRLMAEKLLASRKEQIKVEQVQRGQAALTEHVAALNKRLGKPYMPAIVADFAGAIKGKRTVESLKGAVDDLLAAKKIEASAAADRIQINLATLTELASDHKFLFADAGQIVLKAADDLTMLVKSRIAEHQAAEQKRADELAEKAREKIRAEEAEKLAAEAARKEREEAAKLQREAEEAAMRARDEKARTERDAKLNTPVQDSPQVLKATAPAPDATDREAPASTSPSAGSMGAGPAAGAAPSGASCKTCNDYGLVGSAAQMDAVDCPDCAPAPVAAPVVRAIHPAAAALRNETPTLTLGAMRDRLGFTVTADFLAELGFEATAVKAARLYRESQFGDICAALVQHIESVRAEVALAA